MAIARSEGELLASHSHHARHYRAIYNPHLNAVIADIEQQFSLDQDTLISIISHFHKLLNLGLIEYGHPMAMMYAR